MIFRVTGSIDYKSSGVDREKLEGLHKDISSVISRSYSRTILGAGHYGGIVDIGGRKLVIHTDGVGTKTVLALKYGRIRNTGIDCVAMNVNDIVCVGGVTVGISDYLALERADDGIVREAIEGITEGAIRSEADLVGGETAIMPDVISGYDLSCTAVGVVDRVMTGSEIAPGDIVLGLGSSGPHSNGFSLIRKLIKEERLDISSKVDQYLAPTEIYSPAVAKVLGKIKGASHITGGTFSKIRRLTNHRVEIVLPPPPPIFREIEEAGVEESEMYKVFNMGIGMVVFVPQENLGEVRRSLSQHHRVYELGVVKEGSGILVKSYTDKLYVF